MGEVKKSGAKKQYPRDPGSPCENGNGTYCVLEVFVHPNTPRKTNMEPENEPLEQEIPIKNHHFQAPC